jgi:phosphoribosyl 1,2-cyclic phosphodiesterase
VGFVCSDGSISLGYCTDTGMVTRLIRHHLRSCQAVILEANHDVQMVKDGPYPLPLQQRLLSSRGHLANADALGLAAELAGEQLRLLVLAHLSEVNNHPDLVLAAARQHLPGDGALHLLLARQEMASPLLAIDP